MPSFYSAALNGFPPTPPHINLSGRLESDPAFYASNCPGFPLRYGDYPTEKFSQLPCYPNPAAAAPVSSSRPLALLPGQHSRELAAPKPIMAPNAGLPPVIHGPMSTVNILPPIRTTKLPSMDSAVPPQYRRHENPIKIEPHQSLPQQQALPPPPPQPHHEQQQQHRPKEEKSTGGVAAHLDYEMDQMSDFVAEMAQGIIYPGTTVNPQFRKYVLQILSSTRLPSSTILLGLYYLAARMRMLSAADVYSSGNSHLYRMLTVSLILGSKFLDDNTFQNRSWAEVSGIPVAELNSMELEWLFGFGWKIHDRIHDKQDGFMTWRAHWDTWRLKASVRAHDSRVKLSPIDTSIQRHHQRPVQTPMLSPDGPIPPQYQSSTWMSALSSDYSPPSAPHSGPNTPDYYQAAPWPYGNAPPPYSRNWNAAPPQYSHRSQPPSYHHTPAYSQAFSPPVWTGHGSSCGCLYCAKHQDSYLSAMHFGLQPVAG